MTQLSDFQPLKPRFRTDYKKILDFHEAIVEKGCLKSSSNWGGQNLLTSQIVACAQTCLI